MGNIEWKNLDFMGYGSYSVSTDGQVRNDKTGKVKKNVLNDRGYYQVTLKYNNTIRAFKIHRLVAIAFIPNPDNLPEVNHKDKCRINNNVDNLEWCNRKYNMSYSNINRPVDCYDIEGNYIKTYWSIREASKECSVYYNYIIFCCKGEKNYAGNYRWAYSGCELNEIMDNEPYIEYHKKSNKKYNLKNKEDIKMHKNEYYKEHKDEISKKNMERYQLNKEKHNAMTRAYYQKHKEELNARSRERYHRKKNEAN